MQSRQNSDEIQGVETDSENENKHKRDEEQSSKKEQRIRREKRGSKNKFSMTYRSWARENLTYAGIRWIVGASVGILLYGVLTFVAFPIVLPATVVLVGSAVLNAYFTFSCVYLTALIYGVFNDLIGANSSVTYFSQGHQPDQKKWWLVDSDGIIANAFAWGIGAVHAFKVPSIASIIFGIVTLVCTLVGLPFAPLMLPLMTAGMLSIVVLAAAIAYSTQFLLIRKDPRNENYIRSMAIPGIMNGIGFAATPFVTLPAFVGFIIVTVMKVSLPALIFGAMATAPMIMFAPLAVAGLLAITLLVGSLYVLYLNRNHISLKKMATTSEQPIPEVQSDPKSPGNGVGLAAARDIADNYEPTNSDASRAAGYRQLLSSPTTNIGVEPGPADTNIKEVVNGDSLVAARVAKNSETQSSVATFAAAYQQQWLSTGKNVEENPDNNGVNSNVVPTWSPKVSAAKPG
jgi:hypothetical protein